MSPSRSPSEFLLRRAIPLVLLLTAGVILWFGFTVVGPYAVQHPPGPKNTSFLWYLVYELIAPAILLAASALVFSAWSLWRHGRVAFPKRPGRSGSG